MPKEDAFKFPRITELDIQSIEEILDQTDLSFEPGLETAIRRLIAEWHRYQALDEVARGAQKTLADSDDDLVQSILHEIQEHRERFFGG